MKSLVLLLGVVLLTPATQSRVFAQDQVDFAGTWSGTWKNSTGESGKMTMTLTEDEKGNFTGRWDDVEVSGRRKNRNTLELSGSKPTRSYQYTATIKNGTMSMTYIVTRINMDGSYTGSCTLKRQ